jgi:hypothetical protein
MIGPKVKKQHHNKNFQHIKRRLKLLLVIGLFPAATTVHYTHAADEASEWLTVNVIVFTQKDDDSLSEIPLASSTPVLLPKGILLKSPALGLDFPFYEQDRLPPNTLFSSLTSHAPLETDLTAKFTLKAVEKEPFMRLPHENFSLKTTLSRLRESNYSVLWHGSWHEPLVSARQARSVSVFSSNATESFLESVYPNFSQLLSEDNNERMHNKISTNTEHVSDGKTLFGNLRIIDSGGRVQLETALYLSAESNSFWTIQEKNLLSKGRLFYLDNPAFGVLIQVDDYEIPLPSINTSLNFD